MENKKILFLVFVITFSVILFHVFSSEKENVAPTSFETHVCKQDSLQNVIDSLINERNIERKRYDSVEQHYKKIVLDYEFGLDFIKQNHYGAYKDFIRYSMMREEFDRSIEDEFRERVKHQWKNFE